MKNYQSFLSEQKEFISEQKAKNVASASAMAGLGAVFPGIGAGHDSVVMDTGTVNILKHNTQSYNWASLIMRLPALSQTYNHTQLIALLQNMSKIEKAKVAKYIRTLSNFKSKHTMELLSTSLKKAQPETFIPSGYAPWGT